MRPGYGLGIALALALSLAIAAPAPADTLIDNVDGLSVETDGRIERFTGLLVGDDGRIVEVDFQVTGPNDAATHVTTTFEAESENPVEMQRQGWQAILDSFKKYVESN